jgi:hypothetical protein
MTLISFHRTGALPDNSERVRAISDLLVAVAVGMLALAAQPAAAHVPELRGRLVDLVSRSELIVTGTVEAVRTVDTRRFDTTLRVDRVLLGETKDRTVAFRGGPRLAPGKRYVVLLRRAGPALECIQPSGTVLPARPEDDEAYGKTIAAIEGALRRPENERAAALRTVLIPVLSSSVPPLRYYALLDLSARAHSGLSAADRQSLERLLADPATDPVLRPIVTGLLNKADEPHQD